MPNRKPIQRENEPSFKSLYFYKDTWDGRELGVDVRPYDKYTVNFSTISQSWLKEFAKRVVWYSYNTLSWATCIKRIRDLRRFSLFLSERLPGCSAQDINREIVVIDFLGYLLKKEIKTRRDILSSLKNCFDLASRFSWNDLPQIVIYEDDFPPKEKYLPRYIPQKIIDQFNQHLDSLPEPVMRMVLVLQECGMRVSELCELKFDCLRQDAQGGWFLQYHQFKMKKDHSIPISKELAVAIQEQQKFIRSNLGLKFEYLFSARNHGFHQQDEFKPAPKTMCPSSFNKYLNSFAKEKNICDSSGNVWLFQPHQFRHTVGTNMINNGVPQHIVQRYLGHESPEMTMVYAHIHDETLRKEIDKYYESRVVNFQGEAIELEETVLASNGSLDWFKKNVQARALEHGYCARPKVLGDCDIPGFDGCYNCPHWRTNKNFLPVLQDTLERINQVLNKAQSCGWELEINKNKPIKLNLEKVIQA